MLGCLGTGISSVPSLLNGRLQTILASASAVSGQRLVQKGRGQRVHQLVQRHSAARLALKPPLSRTPRAGHCADMTGLSICAAKNILLALSVLRE